MNNVWETNALNKHLKRFYTLWITVYILKMLLRWDFEKCLEFHVHNPLLSQSGRDRAKNLHSEGTPGPAFKTWGLMECSSVVYLGFPADSRYLRFFLFLKPHAGQGPNKHSAHESSVTITCIFFQLPTPEPEEDPVRPIEITIVCLHFPHRSFQFDASIGIISDISINHFSVWLCCSKNKILHRCVNRGASSAWCRKNKSFPAGKVFSFSHW